MEPTKRALFNKAFTQAHYERVLQRLESELGPVPFRMAETPIILTPELRDRLSRQAGEILDQLSTPEVLNRLKGAVPAHYDAPSIDSLPNVVLVDFAMVHGENQQLEGKVVEIQAFPSVSSLMTLAADAWADELNSMPGLRENWSCFINQKRAPAVDWMRQTLLAGGDPAEVALIDISPNSQKTRPDFAATQRLFGIESACITDLVKEGRSLYRKSGGKLIPVKRLYNRVVFDELEARGTVSPFAWSDDLDVTWCPHPNWYWMWSKHSLPFVSHEAVPKTWFLSELPEIPEDLHNYVLKPVFSFAGSGVNIDVTAEAIAKVPQEERPRWVLQQKIDYAPVLTSPEGHPVKVELRIVLMRPPSAPKLVPLLMIARLSRGRMLGVDFNKGLSWVGGSVAMWPEGS